MSILLAHVFLSLWGGKIPFLLVSAMSQCQLGHLCQGNRGMVVLEQGWVEGAAGSVVLPATKVAFSSKLDLSAGTQ